MKRYTRIAAIVLGAFALGIVVVMGWQALVSEAVDISDRVRRARCTWVDPLTVSIAGHAFSLAATPGTTVYTGRDWISGEEVTGYRQATPRYGFCLATTPKAPLAARSVTFSHDVARRLADRVGLPTVDGPVLEIAEAALFLPDAPRPDGSAQELTVYHRDVDYGWPRMVTRGVDRDGFRLGAVCRTAAERGWLCDVGVDDTRTGLSYRFAPLPLEVSEFDTRPPPPVFGTIARGMRALGDMLEDDAVAQR